VRYHLDEKCLAKFEVSSGEPLLGGKPLSDDDLTAIMDQILRSANANGIRLAYLVMPPRVYTFPMPVVGKGDELKITFS
jgi:hypothetical protein